MIVDHFDQAELSSAFGIDMSAIDGVGVGASWGRVAPGTTSTPHQHDETEVFVITAGSGEVRVGPRRAAVAPGTVIVFEPFDTHVIENTGDEDLVFTTFYWRDAERAATRSAEPRRRLGQRPTFVFSTPPTPNGDLHLGHLSGPYLGADVFVRFQRMLGTEVWHLTGSDDYQSYVVGAAARDGRTPAETAAHYSREIAETLSMLDVHPDQYTATDAEPGYREGLQAFFQRITDSGVVGPREADALFDGETSQYLYEVDVSGGCPGCGSSAGGNICEECGEPNLCVDLVDPRSGVSAAQPVVRPTTRHSLPLHDFRADILAHHRVSRVPVRLRELAARLFRRTRLDIPVTHPATWGVPPTTGADGQVIWVWPEMAYGFLHGIEVLGRRLGKHWQARTPEPEWKIVHFFGYDNSFYHSIMYPALYRLAFPDWAPDIDYHVNEFYLLDGAKFSTSRGHAVWGKEILTPDTVDAVRFFLCGTRPEDSRTNFTHAAYESVLRETLVGRWQSWLRELGERVAKHHGSVAPDAGVWTAEHTAFLRTLQVRRDEVAAALGADGFSLNQAARAVEALVDDTRRFAEREAGLAAMESWQDEARTAMALELAAARLLAVCTAPLMPRFSARLARALGGTVESFPDLVELVAPGSAITLADQQFFATPGPDPRTLRWLRGLVRDVLRVPEDTDLDGRSLIDLGAGSLQVVAVQFRILAERSVQLDAEELVTGSDLAALAALIDQRTAATAAEPS